MPKNKPIDRSTKLNDPESKKKRAKIKRQIIYHRDNGAASKARYHQERLRGFETDGYTQAFYGESPAHNVAVATPVRTGAVEA